MKYILLIPILGLGMGMSPQTPSVGPTVAAVHACQDTWTEARDLLLKTTPYLSGEVAARNSNVTRTMTEVIFKLDPGPGEYDAYGNYCRDAQLASLREQIQHLKAVLAAAPAQ